MTYIGIITGAVAGFLYWKFVGCTSGTCPITSNKYISIAYGALLGSLLFSTFAGATTKSGFITKLFKKDTTANYVNINQEEMLTMTENWIFQKNIYSIAEAETEALKRVKS